MNTPHFGHRGYRREIVRRERMLILGGGALALSFSAIITLLLTTGRPVEAEYQVPAKDDIDPAYTVALVVPTTSVQPGVRLNRVTLRKIYWPRDNVPEGAIREQDAVETMFAVEKLAANQPIIRTALSPTPPVVSLGDLLPPGFRAVTIPVDGTGSVEGWAQPGAHVDVMLTYRDSQDGKQKTRAAINDARVLSFDGNTSTPKEQTGFAPASGGLSTVTLAVTAADVLRLRTAQAMGRISLALRNPNEFKAAKDVVFAEDQFAQGPTVVSSNGVGADGLIGMARATDEHGVQQEFELHSDERWHRVESFAD